MRENSELFEKDHCIRYVRQMTSGLKYLHNNVVLHGNINSGNVLMFSDPNNSHDIVLKWYDLGSITNNFFHYISLELKIYGQFLQSIFGETLILKAIKTVIISIT